MLIVPYAGVFKSIGADVPIGWNGSLEARHGVRVGVRSVAPHNDAPPRKPGKNTSWH